MLPDWFDALALMAFMLGAAVLVALVTTRSHVRYRIEQAGTPRAPGFASTLEGLTESPSRPVRRAELLGDVEAIYAAMLDAIRRAEHSVTFETYLFSPGALADAFAEAFCERARAGVRVKLLFDADGSRRLPATFLERLSDAGCEVRRFRPFLWYQPAQYNHRTHRKLLITDGRVGFTGGAGIADMWLGPPPWLEAVVRLEGEIVGLLQGAFFRNWVIAGGSLCMGPAFFPAPEAGESPARGMVTTSSPLWGDSSMRLLYYAAIASAQERLYLASPYFLPSWDTSAALAAAAGRGVDVRVVVPGPQNDKPVAYYASRRLYGPLLAGGVRVFEYQPAMMHAKAMRIDARWSTLGSANFDPRSFFLNSELTTSIDDPELARALDAFFADAFAASHEIRFEDWKRRGLWEHAWGSLGLIFKDQL